ncbi:hypothetical protein, partial [Nonomuraea basaltis]|uniref:hypothetical protein n=1 Tax=Nonomuraea basaltis TaxID=2495887 RepID=UPI00198178E0
HPHCPPPPETSGTSPRPTAADNNRSWPSSTKTPNRPWPARDIARHLGDVTLNTIYRQLSRWADSRLIRKIRPGVYTAGPISPALLPAAQKP